MIDEDSTPWATIWGIANARSVTEAGRDSMTNHQMTVIEHFFEREVAETMNAAAQRALKALWLA